MPDIAYYPIGIGLRVLYATEASMLANGASAMEDDLGAQCYSECGYVTRL